MIFGFQVSGLVTGLIGVLDPRCETSVELERLGALSTDIICSHPTRYCGFRNLPIFVGTRFRVHLGFRI